MSPSITACGTIWPQQYQITTAECSFYGILSAHFTVLSPLWVPPPATAAHSNPYKSTLQQYDIFTITIDIK